MDEVIGDLQRRLANVVRRGVIHSVQFGEITKCRVTLGEIITTWLPVCQGFAGVNRLDFNPPAVGDAVTVLSEGGDLNNGRVFPGWNTGNMPVPNCTEHEHVTQYSDGTEVRYEREVHALTISIAAGGSYKIIGNGMLDGPVEITKTLTVQGKTQVNADLSSSGEVSDRRGAMSQIRTVYGGHDHSAPGGMTGKPNQPM